MKVRITYNAPVVLTFALLAVLVYAIPGSVEDLAKDPFSFRSWFVGYPHLGEPYGVRSYVGLFTHTLGHAGWEHLLGNFMLILLVGPILEERHGSLPLLVMMAITALVTGIVNALLFHQLLIGASGIAFMMILLASTANIRQGEIPLTFIAVALVYLGGEVYRAFSAHDNVAHGAHIVGGLAGAFFGFIGARARGPKLGTKSPPAAKPGAKPQKPLDAAAKLDKIKI